MFTLNLPRFRGSKTSVAGARGRFATTSMGRPTLTQDEFQMSLYLERKRSERSRKPLLLLLLDGCGLFATDGAGSVQSRTSAALIKSTRETDMVGWHLDNSVLAVLWTEVAANVTDTAQHLRTRIATALQTALSPDQAKQIKVSVYAFPSEDDSGGVPNAIFYPETGARKALPTFLKRSIDVVGSILALLVAWPVCLVIAALIKATSPGPILYRQTRIGQYGREFTFLKFRTMYVDCDYRIHEDYIRRLITGEPDVIKSDCDGNHVYKMTDDPRVTCVGHFLRRTSLDELPQLINVLLNDMSLVGPRPPLPYEVERYEPWHHRRILTVKPGITGLWQVNGRSRTTFDEMVRLDLQYVNTVSITLDLKILLQTPRAVLVGTGY